MHYISIFDTFYIRMYYSSMDTKTKTPKRKMIRVQVPIPEQIKQQAEEKALEMGFGSLQEVIRLFLSGYVKDKYEIGFGVKQSTVKE